MKPTQVKKHRASSTKKVRFAQASTLVITHPKTEQDLKATWYTKAEMKPFKQKHVGQSAKAILTTSPSLAETYIEQSLAGHKAHFDPFCGVENVCGIEHLLNPHVCKALITSRSLTVGGVLEEQDRQERLGIYDEKKLAEASLKVSLFSRLWRHKIALMNCSN